ncbi:MAG: class I SAM-dependent methyltransferase [Nitrosomonadales bacterium]|nr:class I SAM-dependent methyltransferase [Nitrosomonadales bacterium]
MTKIIDRIRDINQLQTFPEPQPVMSTGTADEIVAKALSQWQAATPEIANQIASTLAQEFPDQAQPDNFWHSESSVAFRDFFVWGHNHDFGHGFTRAGAMGPRHTEITSEALRLGMLPPNLENKQVLDVGCWSGGDLLVLAGLGGRVTAIEEHPIAARAARRLTALLGLDAPVLEESLFVDKPEWKGQFDYAYCSGVIYHVTDPMLLLRILFAYLKVGGEVFIETKGTTGEGSICSYSGTLEKGWNWYAPNETAFGRWLVDAGFDEQTVQVYRRDNGRLLAYGRKTEARALRETAGFSRPGSWLEGVV